MDGLSIPFSEQVRPRLRWKLSFRPYLTFIEDQLRKSNNTRYKNYLASIAAMLKENPALLEPADDPLPAKEAEEFNELSELIRLNHIPPGLHGEEPIFAMGTPFPMRFFFSSERFRSLMLDGVGMLRSCMRCDFDTDNHLRKLYWLIVEKSYGVPLDRTLFPKTFLHLTDEDHERKKYYRLSVNQHFVTIRHEGPLPELRQEWVDFATGAAACADQLLDPLPLENFVAEGFMIFTVAEETVQMSLQELQKAVADMHTVQEEKTLARVRGATLSLLGDESIELGILPSIRINNEYKYHPKYRHSSLIYRLLDQELPQKRCSSTFYRFLQSHAQNRAGWLIYNALDGSAQDHELLQLMKRNGFQSFGIFPVWNRENLLGILEIASPRAGAIDAKLTWKIEKALPLYREYLAYELNKVSEQINSHIMRRYTAIQPAVRWKFNEMAWQGFEEKFSDNGKPQQPADIYFKQLYPFYGAVDIRNSSVQRLNAVRQDLWLQLEYLETLLDIANGEPGVAEKQDKVRQWQKLINLNVTLEQEADLRDFLEDCIQLIGKLRRKGALPVEEARLFEQKMRDETSDFHLASWSFEQSMQKLNEAIKVSLESAETELQAEIPHYFEKFMTDGWEFNLYAGESIAPWRKFGPGEVEAIRRWQLNAMIEMARTAGALAPQLPYPLNTTQLILAHGNKVDISYRGDERRFDVAGASSIRYEVIKKRIDKVRLRNSKERLTQPGTIAVVYVHSRDGEHYRKHLEQLVAEGKLLPGIRKLDLEDLQGISGLKAFRARINFKR